jgi:hypothetical protein
MARRARRASKRAANAEVEQLISAVKFVGASSRLSDHEFQNYFNWHNGQLTATDGVHSAGALTREQLDCCPNIEQLTHAITQCQDSSALTQVTDVLLRVTSPKFRGNIECVRRSAVHEAAPDNPTVAIDQSIIDALVTLSCIASNTATSVIQCVVQLDNYTCSATDGGIAAQIYHGQVLVQTPLAVPKAFIDLLSRTKKTPAWLGVGADALTLTIFYTDDSWYKTQLYETKWPNIDNVFTHSGELSFAPIPSDFTVGIDTIKPVTDDNVVYINDNIIASHVAPEKGAFFVMKAPIGTFKTNIKHLALLPKLGVQEYSIYDIPGSEIFYGQGMCGAMPLRVAVSAMD